MRNAAKPIPPISAAVEKRLFACVEKRADGIWAWLKPRCLPSNAKIYIAGSLYAVNRVMWVIRERLTNPDYQIPEGMDVCHRNDVTPELYDCCPDNLWLGTHKENMADKNAKGRGNYQTGDRNGARTKRERMTRGDQHHFRLHPELHCKGEMNNAAKLTWAKVREIRAIHATTGMTDGKIAEKFGVSRCTINEIVNLKTWREESGGSDQL